MIQVRLWGETEEVKEFADYLKSVPRVQILSRSDRYYADRVNSVYERVYIDAKLQHAAVDDDGKVKATLTLPSEKIKTFNSRALAVIGLEDAGIITGKADLVDMILIVSRLKHVAEKLTKKLAYENGILLPVLESMINDTCAEIDSIILHQKRGEV